MGGDPGDPRQRARDQAAAPDVGPVLGRRANIVPALPPRGEVRAGHRLQFRPGSHQRHRVRQKRRVRAASRGGRSALRVSAVRWHRQRREQPPEGGEPVRRQAQGDRQPLQRGRPDRPRNDARQHRQQRPGRTDRPVRARQPEEDRVHRLSAGVVHRSRRRDHR